MTTRQQVAEKVGPARHAVRELLHVEPVGIGIGGNSQTGFMLSVILPDRPFADLPETLLDVPVEYQFASGQPEALGGTTPSWRQASLKRRFG